MDGCPQSVSVRVASNVRIGRKQPGRFWALSPRRALSANTCLSLKHAANSGELRHQRWRRCSVFALSSEIPCRIERVRDNPGGGVSRQGSSGCYFGVRINAGELLPCRVACYLADLGSLRMASSSETQQSSPVAERRLCLNFHRSSGSSG